MTATLRRELRKKIEDVLRSKLGEADQDLVDLLADATLGIRGIQNAGIDWQIAAGLSSEEIAKQNRQTASEAAILSHYEREMVYPTLDWDSDRRLERLRKFLITKTTGEITRFAEWSKRKYSDFTPSKARQYPELVIDLWNQAEPEKKDADSFWEQLKDA